MEFVKCFRKILGSIWLGEEYREEDSNAELGFLLSLETPLCLPLCFLEPRTRVFPTLGIRLRKEAIFHKTCLLSFPFLSYAFLPLPRAEQGGLSGNACATHSHLVPSNPTALRYCQPANVMFLLLILWRPAEITAASRIPSPENYGPANIIM